MVFFLSKAENQKAYTDSPQCEVSGDFSMPYHHQLESLSLFCQLL